MRHLSILLLAACAWVHEVHAQWRFEGDSTPSWQQVVERYQALAATRHGASLLEIGHDDDGSPIHLFVLSDGSAPHPDSIRAQGRSILWITNGIHPGEPDGIDASLLLARALLDSDQYMGLLANTAVCIVPVYNVSGARQRSATSRANQNGPQEYGFRANARYLDLNRDFIKADSRNTRTLIGALNTWDPDVYFETHVSNGADHQYVMELLTTHPDKLDPALRSFLQGRLVPRAHEWMRQRGMMMGPYFETLHAVPEEGLTGFMDGPRYSTGYNALRQRIGILSESHMLKPYADRVNATFQLMLGTLAAMNEHPEELRAARRSAKAHAEELVHHPTNWRIDTAVVDTIDWAGYAVERVPSEVTGSPRVRYDHGRPIQQRVPWLDHAKAEFQLQRPVAYLIPQAWHEVIERLRLDAVPVEVITTPRSVVVEVYYIDEETTTRKAYEGRHVHSAIRTTQRVDTITAQPGDVWVPMGQATDALVMEILEPRCADSFFAWGFFDAILQQKEWFSDYVFEDIAAELLRKDPGLQQALEEERERDPEFAKDAWAQLYFVYRRSPYFEPGHRRYPVLRVVQ